MKLTKRKGFNFFRSYYDVYNELESDKDKVAFIDALLDRQFLGVKPTDLKGMAKFAYISQTNSIDSQVKGYETKTKTILLPPTVGVEKKDLTPTRQVQVQVEGKEKVQDVKQSKIDFDVLLTFLNTQSKKQFRVINSSTQAKFKARLKDGYTKEDIKNTIVNAFKDEFHKECNYKHLTPDYFSRSATIDRFSQVVTKDIKKTWSATNAKQINNTL